MSVNDVPGRSGHPRLVVASGGHAAVGSPKAADIQQVFTLDADEWVYSDVPPSSASQVDGVLVQAAGLHHGDRLELGGVTLVFQRDEDADHGRPHGGRQGGEFAGGGAGGGGEATEPGEQSTTLARGTSSFSDREAGQVAGSNP